MNTDLARELRGFVQLMKLGGNIDLKYGQGASDALYDAAVIAGLDPTVASGHAHNINNAMIALQGTVDASLSRLDIAAKSLDLPDKLEVCPDGCYRPKARNADDCVAGCCSKWYAIRDEGAVGECLRLKNFWIARQKMGVIEQEALEDLEASVRHCLENDEPYCKYPLHIAQAEALLKLANPDYKR